MALLITAFSLFGRLGFAMFVVDFAHKLHFQVRLVKDECYAVAHHNLFTLKKHVVLVTSL